MSDSIKKYEEMQENVSIYRNTELLTSLNITLTDKWSNDCDHYIYEETTSDGYVVYISTSNPKIVDICDNVFYYDTDLGDELANVIKKHIYNKPLHVARKIHISMLYKEDWIEDTLDTLYEELVNKDITLLGLIANND